ncbi:hypothetical protein HPB47_023172 [Ixodes persulcatus]|uniref:Uncharacterized protein n=1 Tax=Ixodes persulcatus TaxID=34615 RepID=A0AC60Q8L0_IXOPE|nr:hypothetical protein HPB47_023172 [Ixodes persulcatus]
MLAAQCTTFMAVGSFLDGPTMAIIVSFTQPMTPDILPSGLRPVSMSYLSLGVSGKRSQPRRTPTRRTTATDTTRTETTTVFSPEELLATLDRPGPLEASLREQMGLAQRIFLQAIAAVGAPMEPHYRDALVDSFQAVANVATQLLEENAFLKGRLVERPPTNEHTHNSYASMLIKGLNNIGVPNTDEQPELLSRIDATRNEKPPPKAALLTAWWERKASNLLVLLPRGGKSTYTFLSSVLHLRARGREVLGESEVHGVRWRAPGHGVLTDS